MINELLQVAAAAPFIIDLELTSPRSNAIILRYCKWLEVRRNDYGVTVSKETDWIFLLISCSLLVMFW